MASPTRDAGLITTNDSPSTSHSFDVPTGSAGDRLILMACQGQASAFTDGSLNNIVSQSANGQHISAWWIDDTGQTTLSLNSSGSVTSVGFVWRVSDDLDPDTQAYDSGGATGGSGLPNPPNVNVTDGPQDVLVLIGGVLDNAENISGAPTNYINLNTGSTSGGTRITGAFADRAITSTSSEDPGAFTGSGSDDWDAVTVIIQSGGEPPVSVLPGAGSVALDEYAPDVVEGTVIVVPKGPWF